MPNWLRADSFLALLIISLFTVGVVTAAPGDILYENNFNSNNELNTDWSRDSGQGNDFQTNTAITNSGSRSLRIRDGSGGTSNSGLMDASGIAELEVSVWVSNGNPDDDPDAGEDLELYYSNSSGTFILLFTWSGSDAAGTIYEEVISLPAAALHDDLRFRFNMTSGGNDDHWYVDDFIVREPDDGSGGGGGPAECIDVFGSAVQTSGATLTLPTFLASGSNTDIDDDDIDLPAGEYKDVTVDEDGEIDFTTVNGEYRIDELEVGENAVARFPPGDYFIDKLEFKQDSRLEIVGSGTVRIYSNEVKFEEGSDIAIGDQYLIIVAYGDVELEEDVNFEGVIFSTDEVKIEEDANFTGAIRTDDEDIDGDATVTYDSSYVTGADFDGMCGGATLTPVAYYDMEEASWGAVIDQISGFNGTAFNGANTTGSATCRYGLFDGVDDYVEIPHDDALNGSDALTYIAYIRPNSWTGIDQIVAKSVHGGGSGRAQMGLFSESGVFKGRAETEAGRIEITSPLPAVAGDWVQVALVFDGTSLTLYQDAVEVATDTFAATTLIQTTDPINISKRVGTDQYYFDGLIDEVRIYTSALSGQDILDLYNTVTPCPLPTIDHIEITTDGDALTCTSETITLRACANADCSTVATEDVAVTLGVTGSATWSTNPITIPANSASGVELDLIDRTPETVTISVSSTSVATTGTSPQCSNGSCQVTFNEAGYILALPNHNSCAASTLTIQAVRLSDNGVSCAPAYSGDQSVNFVYNYSSPGTGSTIPQLDSSAMAAAGVTQNRIITFDASASANLPFSYDDAGRLTITVGDGGDNGLSSASVNTVATPAQLLVFTNDANNACSGADYGGCTEFRTAGVPGDASSEFNLTVAGACSDNTVTPNFALNNITLTPNLVAPASGTNASLGVTSVDITSNGTTTINQTVSNVGAYTITATPGSYLGTTIPAATSSTIGRFTPDRFLITDNNPMLDDATCDFTYQDQETGFAPGLSPTLTVTAVNSAGATATNYGGDGVSNNDFWKFNSADYSGRSYSNQAVPYPGSVTAGLGATILSGQADYDGVHTIAFAADLITHNKAGVIPQTTNDAPFTAQVLLTLAASSLTDSDGIFYDSNTDGSSDDYLTSLIGGTTLRWGRWTLENGFGSELQAIDMNLTAQYFDGAQFVNASTDNCTASVTTSLSNYTDNLASGETTLTQGAISSGVIPLSFSAPGANNTGSVLLTITTPSWLQFDYDGDGSLEDVQATATFGIYEGRRPIIIKRQTY